MNPLGEISAAEPLEDYIKQSQDELDELKALRLENIRLRELVRQRDHELETMRIAKERSK